MIEQHKTLEEELKGKKYVLSDEALFQKQVDLAELRNKIESKIKELEGQLKIEQGSLDGAARRASSQGSSRRSARSRASR